MTDARRFDLHQLARLWGQRAAFRTRISAIAFSPRSATRRSSTSACFRRTGRSSISRPPCCTSSSRGPPTGRRNLGHARRHAKQFSYYSKSAKPDVPGAFWLPKATGLGWPLAIRIDMAPLEPELVKLQPISVLANIRLHRTPGIPYGDFWAGQAFSPVEPVPTRQRPTGRPLAQRRPRRHQLLPRHYRPRRDRARLHRHRRPPQLLPRRRRRLPFRPRAPLDVHEQPDKRKIPRFTTTLDYHFATGDVHVEMLPEAGKLDIDSATPEVLYRVNIALGIEPERARAIALAIDDWRRPGASAAPADYTALGPTFRVLHTSIREIEELLQVNGVTPELFYGTYLPAAEGSGTAGPRLVPHPGLIDCYSVFGSRTVSTSIPLSPPYSPASACLPKP